MKNVLNNIKEVLTKAVQGFNTLNPNIRLAIYASVAVVIALVYHLWYLLLVISVIFLLYIAIKIYKSEESKIINREFDWNVSVDMSQYEAKCIYDKRSVKYEEGAIRYLSQGKIISVRHNNYIITEMFVVENPNNKNENLIKARIKPLV